MRPDRRGADALAEALTLVDRNKERVYEAVLYRLKGELTLQPVLSPRPRSQRSRGVFPESHHGCPRPECEVPRIPCRHEPRTALATAGQTERGAPSVGRDLRLVHRRV